MRRILAWPLECLTGACVLGALFFGWCAARVRKGAPPPETAGPR
jgi:hypothetical protein